MIRWLIAVFILLLLAQGAGSWLQRLGVGRLPGDIHFTLMGRNFSLPIGSTVLLSLLGAALARWL